MTVLDKETGTIEKIIKTTTNSYLVSQTKRTAKGISCDNWFDQVTFNKRFKTINNDTEI